MVWARMGSATAFRLLDSGGGGVCPPYLRPRLRQTLARQPEAFLEQEKRKIGAFVA